MGDKVKVNHNGKEGFIEKYLVDTKDRTFALVRFGSKSKEVPLNQLTVVKNYKETKNGRFQ